MASITAHYLHPSLPFLLSLPPVGFSLTQERGEYVVILYPCFLCIKLIFPGNFIPPLMISSTVREKSASVGDSEVSHGIKNTIKYAQSMRYWVQSLRSVINRI